jgi:cytochrome bd-type quinol oxidase subunit 2
MQAGVFAAAVALSKYEGLPRVAVVVIALAIEAPLAHRRTWAPGLCLALGAVVGYAPWLAFEFSHGIQPSAEHLSTLQPQALGSVLTSLVAVLAGVRTGGGVLVVLLAAGVAGRSVLQPPARLLGLVVLGQAAATLLAFLLSDTTPEVEVRTAATRLIEQFMPLALVACGVWLSPALETQAVEAPEPEPIIASTGR